MPIPSGLPSAFDVSWCGTMWPPAVDPEGWLGHPSSVDERVTLWCSPARADAQWWLATETGTMLPTAMPDNVWVDESVPSAPWLRVHNVTFQGGELRVAGAQNAMFSRCTWVAPSANDLDVTYYFADTSGAALPSAVIPSAVFPCDQIMFAYCAFQGNNVGQAHPSSYFDGQVSHWARPRLAPSSVSDFTSPSAWGQAHGESGQAARHLYFYRCSFDGYSGPAALQLWNADAVFHECTWTRCWSPQIGTTDIDPEPPPPPPPASFTWDWSARAVGFTYSQADFQAEWTAFGRIPVGAEEGAGGSNSSNWSHLTVQEDPVGRDVDVAEWDPNDYSVGHTVTSGDVTAAFSGHTVDVNDNPGYVSVVTDPITGSGRAFKVKVPKSVVNTGHRVAVQLAAANDGVESFNIEYSVAFGKVASDWDATGRMYLPGLGSARRTAPGGSPDPRTDPPINGDPATECSGGTSNGVVVGASFRHQAYGAGATGKISPHAVNPKATTASSKWHTDLYHRDWNTVCGGTRYADSIANLTKYVEGTSVAVTYGKWMKVRQRVTMNSSASTYDGRLEEWIDGVKVTDRRGLRFRDGVTQAWWLLLDFTRPAASAADGYVYWKGLRVWKETGSNSTKVVRIRTPKNTHNATPGGVWNCGLKTKNFPRGFSYAKHETKILFGDRWEWQNQTDPDVEYGGKLPSRWTHCLEGFDPPQGGDQCVLADGTVWNGTSRIMWKEADAPLYYYPTSPANKRKSVLHDYQHRSDWNTYGSGRVGTFSGCWWADGSPVILEDKRWYTLVHEVWINDKNQANGRVRITLDGQVVLDMQGIPWRGDADEMFNWFGMHTFFGGQDAVYFHTQDEDIFLKDFTITWEV